MNLPTTYQRLQLARRETGTGPIIQVCNGGWAYKSYWDQNVFPTPTTPESFDGEKINYMHLDEMLQFDFSQVNPDDVLSIIDSNDNIYERCTNSEGINLHFHRIGFPKDARKNRILYRHMDLYGAKVFSTKQSKPHHHV